MTASDASGLKDAESLSVIENEKLNYFITPI